MWFCLSQSNFSCRTQNRFVGHGSQLLETLLGRESPHNLSTLTVSQKNREHCGLPSWPRLMLDHENVGKLRCLYHNYCSFCHTEELLLNFTFAKISSRLLFADFLFEVTQEDDDLAASAAFLFRPDGLRPVARAPAVEPWLPAAACVSTTFAKTFFALSFNARLFNDCFPNFPLLRYTTSGNAASKTFCPTCFTKGPTFFFKSGMAVRPTRSAKAPITAPEPNCPARPWNVPTLLLAIWDT